MEKHREVWETQRLGPWSLAAALGAVLFAGLLTATPARADSNFERGFENEMGRILAHETVALGKHVIAQASGVPYAVHATVRGEPYRDDYEPQRRHRHFHRYAERGHRKHAKRHHGRHHRHHEGQYSRDCGGRY
jgi:hypothetical protein